METINNLANTASNAIWGEGNNTTTRSGTEPLSGERGTGNVNDPYDHGNQDINPSATSTIGASDSVNRTGSSYNNNDSTSYNTNENTSYNTGANTDYNTRDNSSYNTNDNSSYNNRETSSYDNNRETSSYDNNRENSSYDSNRENTSYDNNDRSSYNNNETSGTTSSTNNAPTSGLSSSGTNTAAENRSGPSEATSSHTAGDPSGTTTSQKHQGADRPQEEPSDKDPKVPHSDKEREEFMEKGREFPRDPNDHSGEPLKMHGGEGGSSEKKDRSQSVSQEGGNPHGKTMGTGEQYVKSSGVEADGGDFDATNPGAGQEATRLMEEKGIKSEGTRIPPEGTAGTGETSGLDHDNVKVSKVEKIKEKLHLKH